MNTVVMNQRDLSCPTRARSRAPGLVCACAWMLSVCLNSWERWRRTSRPLPGRSRAIQSPGSAYSRMRHRLIGWAFGLILPVGWIQPTDAQDQLKPPTALDQMLRLFPGSEPWEQWLKTNHEQPPEFDLLPSVPYLPDPLRFADGQDVKSAADWRRRRAELLPLLAHYVLGSVPPSPNNVKLSIAQTLPGAGATVHAVTLEFGPQWKARLNLELIVPPGPGPFPVFLTQDNHRPWALVAVSRGYIGCVYAGADSRDDTDAFAELWPDQEWTGLTRRAWAASRCVDYLLAFPKVDRARIAIAGQARNGKQSIIAAALDERIAAVISSSAGAGGVCSYRLFAETQFGEGLELLTRTFPDGLPPRLRFFAGRENKLPIDQPELLACIAPRPCLISTALHDASESVWAVEQSFYSAQRVYACLGVPVAINLHYRAGGQETHADDIEAYLDWLDAKFGRRPAQFGDRPIFPTYADWLRLSGERIDPSAYPSLGFDGLLTTSGGNPIVDAVQWQSKRAELRGRVLWGLGEPPPVATTVGTGSGGEAAYVDLMLGRAGVPDGMTKYGVNFGNDLSGDLYAPEHVEPTGRKIPAIIWVHPISSARGYAAGYRLGGPFHLVLAQAGFAVFAFDQIGNGTRLEEVRDFYTRYPHWSLAGKTVQDVASAIDALSRFEFIDQRKIALVGFDLGSVAALYAAALDERVSAVVAIGGIMPMRLNTVEKGTGGIARWSQWLPWQPRLGAFVGNESRLPFDFHEILGMIAPRPVLIVAPQLDYQCVAADLRTGVEAAGKVYALLGGKRFLQLLEPEDYHHLSPAIQKLATESLKRLWNMPGSESPGVQPK
jgi:pimeloyl-ACP methyl ester carboxylesterase